MFYILQGKLQCETVLNTLLLCCIMYAGTVYSHRCHNFCQISRARKLIFADENALFLSGSLIPRLSLLSSLRLCLF